MNPIDVLAHLDATHDYLRRPGDATTRIDHVAAFTRHAAWLLRESGWANIHKTHGEQRRALDVDKLINRHTFEIVDIVIAAGDPSQRIGWQSVAVGNAAMVADPTLPDEGNGDPGQVDPPSDGDISDVLERIDECEQHLRALLDVNERIFALLAAAAHKFGIEG